MQANTAKASRILYLKIKAPSADAAELILSMIKNASHLYKVFGGAKIRLLRNSDDHAQFLQVIEYETDPSVESGRQKLPANRQCRIWFSRGARCFPAPWTRKFMRMSRKTREEAV